MLIAMLYPLHNEVAYAAGESIGTDTQPTKAAGEEYVPESDGEGEHLFSGVTSGGKEGETYDPQDVRAAAGVAAKARSRLAASRRLSRQESPIFGSPTALGSVFDASKATPGTA